MSRRLLLLILSALALVGALPVAPTLAQGGDPRLVTEFEVPGAIKLKFPTVGVRDGTVHVGATHNEATALYWNKAETATSFSQAFEVGSAQGQGDYSSASLFVAPDNTVYYVWGSIEERRLKLRVRDAAGNWGPERTVLAGGGNSFPIFPRVAFSQGRIFVIWQDIDKPLYVKTSTDGGATFSNQVGVGQRFTFSAPPAITVGPNNEVALAYNSKDYEIFAAVWNGTSFVEERVTPFGFSNPSITIGPNGTIYAAFRGIGGDVPFGAYYAERQSAGNWARRTLVNGTVEGAVNVVAGEDGTLHFAWQAKPSGAPQIFYAFQAPGQARTNAIGGQAGAVFNPSLAVGDTGSGLAHVVAERFGGDDNTRLRYYLFEGQAIPAVDAVPRIEGAAVGAVPVVAKKENISVGFDNVQNGPTEIRWNWGSAPTDADNDSGGWKAFQNPIQVPVLPDLPADCSEVTLYTQVRNANASGSAQSAKMRIDGTVDAQVSSSNPYSKRKAPDFSGDSLADFVSNGGASDGDSAYTRAPVFYLELQNQADCSGLKDVATGQSSTNLASAYPITDGKFANIVPFPQLPDEGPTNVVVRVSDVAGNIRDYTQEFTYDTTPPTLSSSGPDILSLGTTTSSLLVNLEFEGVQVSDNLYPDPGFWGIWVANSRTPVADPLSNPDLLWVPVHTPGVEVVGGSASFISENWSLGAGLPESQVTPGTYYVYVRFLDGAGNPSAAYLSAETTLNAITLPAMYLPILQK